MANYFPSKFFHISITSRCPHDRNISKLKTYFLIKTFKSSSQSLIYIDSIYQNINRLPIKNVFCLQVSLKNVGRNKIETSFFFYYRNSQSLSVIVPCGPKVQEAIEYTVSKYVSYERFITEYL